MLQLEKFCYYQHLSLSGGQERPIFACRIVDIRGTRFHVLSRIQDAGLDFTGRTNFIAHHLVFTPEEIRQFPTPPVILRDWPGWVKSWTKEPQLLENEDWSGLTTLTGKTNVPAQTWQRVTGDAVNGYGLLEARVGASFRVDDQTDETILELLAESLELLEVRDTRRDFRTAAWNCTFTTSMQEQDNPADFRWRCIHSDNPAASRFTPPDCRALSAVRATKWTGEETAFARTGRQGPRFVAEPQDARITEGEAARFTAKAEGVPNPTYQWFSVDRANNGQVLSGEMNPELVVSNPALGISRYVVSVTNNAGNVQSRVATLSVEQKLKLAKATVDTGSRATAKPALYNVKSGEDIERQRRRLESEEAQKIFQKKLRRNKILVAILAIVLIASAGVFIWWKKFAGNKFPTITRQLTIQTNMENVVIIQVTAIGTSPLIYQWYKDKQPILSATNSSLLLTNSGSFSVIITNSIGSATSTVVLWPVISVPVTMPTPNLAQTQPDTTNNSTSQTPDPKKTLQEDFFKLPPSWNKTSVGKEDEKSSVFLDSNNTFVLTGYGKNIYGQSDNFFFVYQSISNSVEFIARLSGKIDETTARRGLMMRGATNADAPFAFIGLSQTNILWGQRPVAGSNCTFTNLPVSQLPIFFRLNRNTNTFSGAFSPDGTNWTGIKTDEIFMPDHYLLGFAVCSGNKKSVQANFDNMSIKEAKQ